MKKFLQTIILAGFMSLNAQIKIGNNKSTIGTSSLLELEDTSKALLISRVASSASITNPVNGMIIYDMQSNCIKFFQANAWSICGLAPASSISAYTCTTISTGVMQPGQPVSGVTQTIIATVTTAGLYSISTFAANGITFFGSGIFPGTGQQNVVLTATGTPIAAGVNTFTLSTTPSCSFSKPTVTNCILKVSPTENIAFMCHNLGADTTLNPNNPVFGINGYYYQWGMSTIAAYNYTNSAPITGWNTTPAANGAWLESSKTLNDPCPTGYRVPTTAQWNGVTSNNTLSTSGTWYDSQNNYSAAFHYGPNASTKSVTFPAAGYRSDTNGSLIERGLTGFYWSSTENGTNAFAMVFICFNFGTPTFQVNSSSNAPSRTTGLSVRCVGN